jgi:Tfp pilus assembly protein FimV
MATTIAQPGTGLKKIARQYAKEAGVPVEQYLQRLRRLNPDFSRATGSDSLRLGRGVGVQRNNQQQEEMPEEFDQNQVMNILDSPL